MKNQPVSSIITGHQIIMKIKKLLKEDYGNKERAKIDDSNQEADPLCFKERKLQ